MTNSVKFGHTKYVSICTALGQYVIQRNSGVEVYCDENYIHTALHLHTQHQAILDAEDDTSSHLYRDTVQIGTKLGRDQWRRVNGRRAERKVAYKK